MSRSRSHLWPGQPYPPGATWDGAGVNFALFSERATSVELCLFDGPDAGVARETIALRERTDLVWHCYIPGRGPGQLYGYRVHGPDASERGLRFNPSKFLIDPYARALAGHSTGATRSSATGWAIRPIATAPRWAISGGPSGETDFSGTLSAGRQRRTRTKKGEAAERHGAPRRMAVLQMTLLPPLRVLDRAVVGWL